MAQTRCPVAEIPLALFLLTLFGQRDVVVKEQRLLLECRLEAVRPVLNVNDPLRLDGVGQRQRVAVAQLVGLCLFGDELEAQELILPASASVDCEVERHVAVRQRLAPQPHRFFCFLGHSS